MAKPSTFRIRWKGTITGPLTLAEISNRLRAGDISLIHNIEVEGSWITIREYFRAIGLSRSPLAPAQPTKIQAANIKGLDSSSEPITPPNPAQPAGIDLELTARVGYLWCGSTFIFPLLLSAIVPILEFLNKTPLQFWSRMSLFVFSTLLGCGLPYLSVRRIGHTLESEGLHGLAQDQYKLFLILAAASALVWMIVFWSLARS